MFRKLRSALVRGLVVVLPIGLTLWLLWWLGSATEALLRRLILLVVPPEHYQPGMGIVAAVLLLLAAGTLFNAYSCRARSPPGSGSSTGSRSSRRSMARPGTSRSCCRPAASAAT